MHRSPFLFVAILIFSASLWAQQQPGNPEPKDTSGAPQIPMANPQAPNPPSSPAQTQLPTATTPPAQTPGPAGTAPGAVQSSPSGAGAVNPGSFGKEQPGKKQAVSTPTPTSSPSQPKTEILDSSATSGALATDGHDPILDTPPFPSGGTTLVGGIIRDIDRIRNRMVVHVFGGGRWTVNFDERTHIFRNGAEATALALRKGERVYVDTMFDEGNHDIFARNIRVGIAAPPADASGQIVSVDTAHGEIGLRDNINSVPVHFGVDKDTRINNGNTPIALKDIKPGALVHVKFAAEGGYRGIAREVSILAMPGAAFTFSGTVSFLDLHRGLLAIKNIDGKTYDIRFSPRQSRDTANLSVGTPVTIVAIFEGSQYTAQSVNVNSAKEEKD
jgi:Domain of unknown function (DUF5666)